MDIAYAHVGDPAATGVFKWDIDPTLVFFTLILFFYVRSLKHFRGPDSKVKTWQKIMFFLGIATLILGLLPPIDPLADKLFFMHMVQHLMITLIGVPLILFGVPFFVIIRGAPLWFRKKVYFPILRSKVWQGVEFVFGKPLASLIFFELNFWFWHIPRYYDLALRNDFFHILEHGMFAVSAMFLWRNIIDPHPLRSPLPLPARLIFMGILMAVDVVLSALLTFSDKVLYAYEGVELPSWWVWGHLEDQKLGALIMWVPGGTIYLIATTVIFFVWAHREQKKDAAELAAATRAATLATEPTPQLSY
ncbi:MAG: cytochrome c oxidase assembly protein [Oligoflexales bacterium]